ncbi:hypothetical protein vseg_002748 [Gypsophila vaccaria]
MEPMMSVEGGTAQAAPAAAPAAVDPNSVETYQAGVSQGYTYPYYPPVNASTPASWPTHGDHSSTGNGNLQSYSYQYHQQPSSTGQDGATASSLSSTPVATGTDNTSHIYTNYTTYPPSTNQYGYGSAEYANYYSGYQQQPNQPHTQAQGAYQNTGSPYQPISSFQNTGSYAAPTSYTSTYYNPGDYQTTGAYTGSSYSSQTNTWSQGNYANYTHQYASYSQELNSTYSSSTASTTAAATTDYQQQYKQWADYYSSQTEVTCAPGTETTPATNTTTASSVVPEVSAGYMTAFSQPQPSYTTTWKLEPTPPAAPSEQTGSTVGAYNDYWKHAAQALQNQHASSASSSYQKPSNVNPTYTSVQNQQQTVVPQVPSTQYMEVQQTHQQSFQALPPTDLHRVSSLQIPTNPRIVSNLGLGMSKTVKDSSPSSVTAKPAYVSVSLSNQNKTLPTPASDSNVKPGVFPAALRGYVERALARCKDEKQRAACQEVMKGIITKATDDGTLHSRDWDTEPLFPLPDTSTVNNDQSATPFMSLSAVKRSPSRRTKSRWEPLPEEKAVEKPTSTYQEPVKQGGWTPYNGRDQKFNSGKHERKDVSFSKFSSTEQNSAGRSANRPPKRRRFSNDSNAAENGEGSSDSDKEQNLTAYYSAAVTLADSPEERKRRENRSKRFEKVNGQKSDTRFRPRNAGARGLYARRATALVVSRTSEDGGSRAVEDIDWDSLTVKGTCQDIEKRYLRLTSAPDPSTVRPEDVLEKALVMVQTSEKNYLYKCDQLKSIRQDLTVQRIRNELTVKVYETHARLSLEYGDLPEFNQCLSQLKSLYGEGIGGCHMEFSAYHLLSVILHSNNRRELISSMSRLSVEARNHEAVKHALSVRASVTSGNYVMFFRLYKTAPNLNTCLMDLCVEKMRFEAVQCMSRAYRPSIPVSFIAQVLGFSSAPEDGVTDEKDIDGCDECTEWLKAHGACLVPDNNGEMVLDSKASSTSLYMPEPEDAVAHGDANLAVNDFFTRTAS